MIYLSHGLLVLEKLGSDINSLQDVNDETPTFRSKSYIAEIGENSPRATPILFLGGNNVVPEVYDHDSGTNGTFQLFLEGDQGIFEVISLSCTKYYDALPYQSLIFQDSKTESKLSQN